MPDSNAGQLVKLTVTAPDAATEIFVIDGNLNLVPGGKGLGRLEVRVTPGFYSIKYKSADVISEVTHAITGDTDLPPPAPLAFTTPVPLMDTDSFDLEQSKAAYKLSRRRDLTIGGTAGELFVFVRDLRAGQENDPDAKLVLLNADGHVLHEYDENVTGNEDTDDLPCFGRNIRLPEGDYSLRVRYDSHDSLTQTVTVCSGWQTQVFLFRALSPVKFGPDAETPPAKCIPRLSDAGVGMVSTGYDNYGFDMNSRMFRLGELARKGIVNSRPVVNNHELQQMLYGKWENPMLGIMGAHLVALSKDPDQRLLREVVDNLSGLLPGHSDVRALRLLLPKEPVPRSFRHIPMMRKSWDLIVRSSAEHAGLVPSGSAAEKLAPYLISDTAWATGCVPSQEAAVTPANIRSVDLVDFVNAATKVVLAALPGVLAVPPGSFYLSAIELAHTLALQRPAGVVLSVLADLLDRKAEDVNCRTLVEKTNLPPSTIAAALKELQDDIKPGAGRSQTV